MTKKTGYGLIAMSHLAALGEGQLACAREIAEQSHAPAALMMNVLKKLATAGYIESVRGVRGGYRLARRPEDINLAEVVTALEGPIRLAECVTGEVDEEHGSCKIMDHCPIADPVHRIQRKLSDFLRNVTLAEIVEPSLTG